MCAFTSPGLKLRSMQWSELKTGERHGETEVHRGQRFGMQGKVLQKQDQAGVWAWWAHSSREKTVAKARMSGDCSQAREAGAGDRPSVGPAWGTHPESKTENTCFGVCPHSHQAKCCTGTDTEPGTQGGVMMA